MDKKTILIDGRMWGAGFTGIGQYLREVMTCVIQQMPDTNFVILAPERIQNEIPEAENVTKRIAEQRIYSLSEQTSFLQILKKENADLAFFPHFNVPLGYNADFVATIHDLTILKYQGKKMRRPWHRWIYKIILRHALKKAKGLVSVSEFTKKEAMAFMEFDQQKMPVIPNGVCRNRFENVPREKIGRYKAKYGQKYFLVAGVWREHKNIIGAINAYNLYRQHGGKGKLVITGKRDVNYLEVEILTQQSAFADDIHLTGFIDDREMPALIAAASVLLFPSLAEGFGLPALEAMAAGTPVIAHDDTSLPEACGDAALLIDATDSEQFALAMVDAMEPKISTKMIAKGKAHVQKFSWDKSAQQHIALFQKLLRS